MRGSDIAGSPQRYARAAGLLYLVVIVFGAFAEGFVTNKLMVSGDAAASARNILAAPDLWQLGVMANLLVVICAVPQLWIEFLLLRPVSQGIALLFLLLNLASLAVEAVSKVFLMLVLPILSKAYYVNAFEPQQLEALARLAFSAHGVAFNVALIFFGLACLVDGYLIFRSGYFPRAIGVLMQLAGVSYLVSCFAALFAPAIADMLSPAILLPALIGESSFCLWLLIKGVNLPGWQARQAEMTSGANA